MHSNRRQFIISLSALSATTAIPLALQATPLTPPTPLEKTLHRELSKYGNILSLNTKKNKLTAKVHITNISALPDACNTLSRISPIHAEGNTLQFQSGDHHIHIHNLN